MIWDQMTWEKIYLGCFTFGFLMTLASFLAHSAHFHLPGHHHVGGGGGAGHHHHGGGGAHFSKFNMTTLSAFLTWFGGTGYLLGLYSSLGFYVAMGIAVVAGLAAAAVVFWFVVKVLLRHDRDMAAVDYEMVGVLGRVSSPVLGEAGTGEMIYSREGARRHCAIRSELAAPIAKGTEVIVTRYERGIAYVRRWDELSGIAEDQQLIKE